MLCISGMQLVKVAEREDFVFAGNSLILRQFLISWELLVPILSTPNQFDPYESAQKLVITTQPGINYLFLHKNRFDFNSFSARHWSWSGR
jgi:hypothetical protein